MFRTLKTTTIAAPVPQLPNLDREFIVTTDASEVSVDAILQQDLGKGLQPTRCDINKLNPTKPRNSSYGWGTLGII